MKVAALIALGATFWLAGASSARAAASYVFEPVLSLTGNCSTSLLDPVSDPGPCPGNPGVDHPSAALKAPGITTDAYGDIYVANIAEKEGRIDVFDSEGFFITEFADSAGPQSIAVDSEGNVYLFERVAGGERLVRRFPPSVYKPLEGKIEYAKPPEVLVDEVAKPLFSLSSNVSVAVDSSDRLYVDQGKFVAIFKSAKEGGWLLEAEAIAGLERSPSIAIDSTHEKIYLSEKIPGGSTIRVFELKAPHKELEQIDGSTTPKGEFLTGEGFLALDVDDDTGHVFVGDLEAASKVYEFEEDGTYLQTLEHSFERVPYGEIAVDDGPSSPHPETEGWLFVPSNPAGTGHAYAFMPKEIDPAEVEDFSLAAREVTEAEAVLEAMVNPNGLPTEYRLEFITQQQWEEEGESFANATIAGEGTLPKGGEGVKISAPALELQPGTTYRFRAFAENEEGGDEEVRKFTTFMPAETFEPCGNDPLRVGLAALLPDCRAYELVTPPDTNGHPPTGGFIGVYFATLRAAPDGNRASFLIEGGTIAGQEGAGAFNGDPYLATRGPEGWSSEVTGPSGEEAIGPNPGSVSPDQTYSFWQALKGSIYIRYPDGHSELVGRGSLGEDTVVNANLITENAGHIIFNTKASSAVKLEPNAAPEGTATVYDRPAEGPTHVVSLLPGDEPQKAGENAKYLGASEDGEGIVFEINETIYLRLPNTKTFEVAGPGTTFAGVAKGGTRVFYLEGGDLFAYDAEEEKATPFSTSGDVTPVNVSTGGSRAYFVSPTKLTSELNPNEEEAEEGAENLYLSKEGQISFVGIVTERDVEGEERIDGLVGGLGLWVEALDQAAPAKDPSRATPSGTTLLFESRADLASFESEGFAQVYRYDSEEGRLDCLSCSPTETPPSSDASLQSISEAQFSPEPGGSRLKIPNQSPDGHRAFFQTAEPLVVGDTDKFLDVYEWEAKGTGSCERTEGCVYLISGGHSATPDYLFAMSQSGDDVFFRTADLLLPRDAETTLSLYDARVGGGFPEPEPPSPCEGEGCHPVTPAPALTPPAKPVLGADDEVKPRRHCPKGKRKVKRHGKVVCVKKHRMHHHRAGNAKRGGAK